MAGHSKWHKIRHQKGANDAKRGKIFTKHAHLIALAAKDDPDPETNPALRTAIDAAKAENVPNDNIDRAIKKGSGTGADAMQMYEITYEGYAPGGVALMIETVTDNRNRTVANIKAIMTKNSGTMGEAGSVGYMFQKQGYFNIDTQDQDSDMLELELIELGADDILKDEDNNLEVYTAPENFINLKNQLDTKSIKILESKLSLFPNTTVPVEDIETAQKIFDLIDKLEDDDDVINVISNFDVSEEIMTQLQ